MIVDLSNSEHYVWGDHCDGWILSSASQLFVIEEKIPAGSSETRHFHQKAQQFFYVLRGELTMEIEGITHLIPASSGITVEPMQRHQAKNLSETDVRFLVISSPTTRGDRVECS